jgi:hypothetical protein
MRYLIILALVGCGKTQPDPPACYEIRFTPTVGCQRANLDTCFASGVDIARVQFFDNCGHRVTWSARKL